MHPGAQQHKPLLVGHIHTWQAESRWLLIINKSHQSQWLNANVVIRSVSSPVFRQNVSQVTYWPVFISIKVKNKQVEDPFPAAENNWLAQAYIWIYLNPIFVLVKKAFRETKYHEWSEFMVKKITLAFKISISLNVFFISCVYVTCV